MKKLAALCFVAILGPGCSNSDAPTTFTPTTSLRLESDGEGRLCSSDGECFTDPCGCDAVNVEIDDASGESRETCLRPDGTTNDACGDVVACVTITIPDPDCHVCAWVDGAVVYSSCIVDETLYCETYDFHGNATEGGSAGVPDPTDPQLPADPDPTDPPEPKCEPGNTFAAGDGCNTCECDSDGNVRCTERACSGCLAGETFRADDGCNTCSCGEDGVIRCTEMACGGTCEVCYDRRGNVVVDECRNDCSTAVCPMVACAPGFEARRLDGECCETCVPVDDCSNVDCAIAGLVDCPESWRAQRVPGSCCDYRCEPGDCTDIACPAVELECPAGFSLVSGNAPDCCPHCEPDRTRCTSNTNCTSNEKCSVSDGDCDSSCVAGDENCLAVCTGYCIPADQCAERFVCADGSLPQGTDCDCPSDTCPLDFVCANGLLPEGADCRCGDECLLDFVCENGSQPQGSGCYCPDECPLDFLCADNSQPQGAACHCPDSACYSDVDCPSDSYCKTSEGACNPPPGCDTTSGSCPSVCAGVCKSK